MPVPSNNATKDSVNGTLVPTVLTLQNNDHQARVILSGTYTGVTGTIDLSNDGTTWLPAFAYLESTGATVTGTLSPSASNLSYLVNNVDGWVYARFNPTAVASGTLTATVYSAPSLGANPTVNVTANGSFTTGTFSSNVSVGGTLAVTGVATFTANIVPAADGTVDIGDATHGIDDLFLSSGSIVNYSNGNVVITHSSGILTMGTGELRITTAGTNAASVPTLASTSTLVNKTLTAPVIGGGLTASGSAANTFAGSTGTFITSTGTNTLSGNTLFKIIATPVAATGAGGGVSGAAALGAGNILYVSSDGATKGVKLLTGVAGDMKWIINTSSTACNLFAAAGGTINGGAGDAGCTIPASKGVQAFCTSADTWVVNDMPARAGAAA